ncbi:MAG: beta-ketoacyl synthase N-terminal-like domain-containing protein [Chthoniobacterales bacterium]
MNMEILGKGWVTNHGCGLNTVSEAVLRGKSPQLSEMINPFNERVHHVALIAKEDYAEAENFRRVRRSSTITLLALTAAMRAVQESGIEWNADIARRTALIFVSSDGGVIYTRRFYSEIVKSGASGASPLLFPETVYNAPASHLCAYFGIDGDAITLVGDTAVGCSAMHHASELLEMGLADYCMVVAAEEMDWILCEAYSVWKQTRDSRKEFKSKKQGAIFAEGAAALLLGKSTSLPCCKTHPGSVFSNPREAAQQLDTIYAALTSGVKVKAIVSSANGTEMDAIESTCLKKRFSGVPVHRIKETLGEALAAGTLQQTIFAAQLLQEDKSLQPNEGILVSTLGFNGQAGAVLLTPPRPRV